MTMVAKVTMLTAAAATAATSVAPAITAVAAAIHCTLLRAWLPAASAKTMGKKTRMGMIKRG
jgi:hypothetical protein